MRTLLLALALFLVEGCAPSHGKAFFSDPDPPLLEVIYCNPPRGTVTFDSDGYVDHQESGRQRLWAKLSLTEFEALGNLLRSQEFQAAASRVAERADRFTIHCIQEERLVMETSIGNHRILIQTTAQERLPAIVLDLLHFVSDYGQRTFDLPEIVNHEAKPNNAFKLSVQPVTARACAQSAPGCPAA